MGNIVKGRMVKAAQISFVEFVLEWFAFNWQFMRK